MGVRVRGRGTVGMTQEFLSQLQVACLFINETCSSVPQRMKPSAPFLPGEMQPFQGGIQNIATKNIRIKR